MTDEAGLDMVRAMLTQAEITRVATTSARGIPAVAPFWFYFDGDRIGIRTLENATVRNVRQNAAVSCLVDFGSRYADLRGAVVQGQARILKPEEAPESLTTGQDRKYEEYRREMRALGNQHQTDQRSRVFLLITLERAQWFVLGGSVWGRVRFPVK
jgi:nitroimidazol reductase NimA-like FMN-containing flavoprotein (pyridoxamine 5'-phosphate oxidase superfamily)